MARKNTRVAGGSSPTAIRMNRYGMPQITDIETNSNKPRGAMPGQVHAWWGWMDLKVGHGAPRTSM